MSSQAHPQESPNNPNPTYQPNAKYVLPNELVHYPMLLMPTILTRPSSTEHIRLQNQHLALKDVLHGHTIHVPLSSPKHIMDVGCGTGAVTLDLAYLFPDSTLYGVDISPIPSSTLSRKPPNVNFVQGTMPALASQDSRFAPNTIDFIFSRLLLCGMTTWQEHMNTVAKLFKPGAYIEIQDLEMVWLDAKDDALLSESWRWRKEFIEGAETRDGLDFRAGKNARMYMEMAGLEAVDVRIEKWPLGDWYIEERRKAGKEELGWDKGWMWEQPELYANMIKKLMRGRVEEVEIRRMQDEARETLTPEGNGMWMPFRVTVGRKKG
ncbi:hypothetical protein MMC20_003714 [Loxospora ochrophaea]|nr:hypothetical protein [Loxospora ochrophaea]